jgi:hypothetical protein
MILKNLNAPSTVSPELRHWSCWVCLGQLFMVSLRNLPKAIGDSSCVFYFLFVTGPVLDDVILGCNIFIFA